MAKILLIPSRSLQRIQAELDTMRPVWGGKRNVPSTGDLPDVLIRSGFLPNGMVSDQRCLSVRVFYYDGEDADTGLPRYVEGDFVMTTCEIGD